MKHRPADTPAADLHFVSLGFDATHLTARLSSGKDLRVPLAWFPRLRDATPEQLQQFKLLPREIHWDMLRFDLCLDGLLHLCHNSQAGPH